MKTITITSKRNASNLILDSLFTPVNGRTLIEMKHDGGKYSTSPEVPYIGRTIEVRDECHAVYPVRRKDADGAYIQFMSVCEIGGK